MSELNDRIAQGFVTLEVAALYLGLRPQCIRVYKSMGKIKDHPAVPSGFISTEALDAFILTRRRVGRPRKTSEDIFHAIT